ncbi:PREDICTED: uncharacterized protein LOC105622773 [Atta cephalotes]|uniref:DUF243 domain-containing protein n=1 Tax=Atta cephalotes TaxID=12957 RepID=A0A158NPX0_ATTCE|nr:PREDICTED: uncharacterized protein LOC105622773 [Atta cephalotes]
MREFMILVLAAMAMARPEAGYSYSQPSSSYGAPSGGYSLAGGVGGISSGISVGPSTSFEMDLLALVGAEGGVSGSVNAATAGGFASARQIVRDVYVYGPSKDLEAVGGGAGSTGGGVSLSAPSGPYIGGPDSVLGTSSGRPSQKHYKIIFIKVPTLPTPTAPVIPVQQQDEQKTLIYVLVKKPEEAPEINLPTITPTQPSKPEVYFIKYKTQVKKRNLKGSGTGPSRPSTRYGIPGESGPY